MVDSNIMTQPASPSLSNHDVSYSSNDMESLVPSNDHEMANSQDLIPSVANTIVGPIPDSDSVSPSRAPTPTNIPRLRKILDRRPFPVTYSDDGTPQPPRYEYFCQWSETSPSQFSRTWESTLQLTHVEGAPQLLAEFDRKQNAKKTEADQQEKAESRRREQEEHEALDAPKGTIVENGKRRSARAKKQDDVEYADPQDDEGGESDEQSNEEDDEDEDDIGHRRSSLRRRSSAVDTPPSSGMDNDNEGERPRRRRSVRSLRHNDDSSDGDSDKAHTDGEIDIIRKYPIRGPHDSRCAVCHTTNTKRGRRDEFGDKGAMVGCTRCAVVCHQNCASATKGAGVWKSLDPPLCKWCQEEGSVCALCSKPHNHISDSENDQENEDDEVAQPLFRCRRCHYPSHWECLLAEYEDRVDDDMPARIKDPRRWFLREWKCVDCVIWYEDADVIITFRDVHDGTAEPANENVATKSGEQDTHGATEGDGTADPANGNVATNSGEQDTNGTTEGVSQNATVSREYYIKFNNFSYRDCDWVTERWIRGLDTASHKLRNFLRMVESENEAARQEGQPPPWPKSIEDALPAGALEVETVVGVTLLDESAARKRLVDLSLEDVDQMHIKWEALPWQECSWEDIPDEGQAPELRAGMLRGFQEYLRRQKIRHQMLETPNIQTFAPYESQPECVKNGELKPYQIEGLDWLLYKWLKREGAILADDMGLGKTVQIVALLTSLWSDYRKGPFLICAPSSTVGHWAQELQKWSASELCVVNYRGTAEERQLIREYLIFGDEETRPKRLKRGKNVRCHVVISNYETFLRDDGLAEIAWDAMVCDEGHRLKSDQAKTFTALSRMKVEWKVLLTGTPLQNNLRELFNLLSFLDPSAFNDPVAWENKYGDKELKDDTCVPDLHAALKPYILRRTKDDERVQLNLPPKREYFVPVELTAAQKELYKSVLSKNADLMKAIGVTLSGSSDARLKSLQNLLMELRKICNHPYCFTGIPEYDYTKGMREEKFKEMVDIGGKLALLDRMLPKLQERGHRVLLFSQFRMTLDVLEEYVKGKGWRWARMDGHTPIEVRQPLINAFNSPDSDIFVLLLTTRTGGEGINLTAADTIILYDADWNPHRDIQAMSRVHRIGQQRPVMVYRFFSRGTAEEKILEVGKKKLVLDWMIIEGMKGGLNPGEMGEAVKYGARAMFEKADGGNDENEDEGKSGALKWDSETIEQLLDRSSGETAEENESTSNEDGAVERKKTKAFEFTKIWQSESSLARNGKPVASSPKAKQDRTATVEDEEAFWQSLIRKQHEAIKKQQEIQYGLDGRPKRKRKTVNYGETEKSTRKAAVNVSDDEAPTREGSMTPEAVEVVDDEFKPSQDRLDDDADEFIADVMDVDEVVVGHADNPSAGAGAAAQESTVLPLPQPEASQPSSVHANPEPSRKRGRPRQSEIDPNAPKRPRGRPRKSHPEANSLPFRSGAFVTQFPPGTPLTLPLYTVPPYLNLQAPAPVAQPVHPVGFPNAMPMPPPRLWSAPQIPQCLHALPIQQPLPQGATSAHSLAPSQPTIVAPQSPASRSLPARSQIQSELHSQPQPRAEPETQPQPPCNWVSAPPSPGRYMETHQAPTCWLCFSGLHAIDFCPKSVDETYLRQANEVVLTGLRGKASVKTKDSLNCKLRVIGALLRSRRKEADAVAALSIASTTVSRVAGIPEDVQSIRSDGSLTVNVSDNQDESHDFTQVTNDVTPSGSVARGSPKHTDSLAALLHDTNKAAAIIKSKSLLPGAVPVVIRKGVTARKKVRGHSNKPGGHNERENKNADMQKTVASPTTVPISAPAHTVSSSTSQSKQSGSEATGAAPTVLAPSTTVNKPAESALLNKQLSYPENQEFLGKLSQILEMQGHDLASLASIGALALLGHNVQGMLKKSASGSAESEGAAASLKQPQSAPPQVSLPQQQPVPAHQPAIRDTRGRGELTTGTTATHQPATRDLVGRGALAAAGTAARTTPATTGLQESQPQRVPSGYTSPAPKPAVQAQQHVRMNVAPVQLGPWQPTSSMPKTAAVVSGTQARQEGGSFAPAGLHGSAAFPGIPQPGAANVASPRIGGSAANFTNSPVPSSQPSVGGGWYPTQTNSHAYTGHQQQQPPLYPQPRPPFYPQQTQAYPSQYQQPTPAHQQPTGFRPASQPTQYQYNVQQPSSQPQWQFSGYKGDGRPYR